MFQALTFNPGAIGCPPKARSLLLMLCHLIRTPNLYGTFLNARNLGVVSSTAQNYVVFPLSQSFCLFPSQGSVGMDRVLDFLRQMSPEAEEHDLEELNKTLDPEERDSSVDLEAFQTVVKEWMPRYQSTW